MWQGAAYTFVLNDSGSFVQRELTAGDGAVGDLFGGNVAVGGTGTDATIVVGAPGKEVGGNGEQGAVYLYSPAADVPEQRLTASGGVARDAFGSSVAASGGGATTVIVVGAPTVGGIGKQGVAYAFVPGALASATLAGAPPTVLPSPHP
jgi:hypothetical protein